MFDGVRYLVSGLSFVVLAPGACLQAQASSPSYPDVPRFEGYVVFDDVRVFALTAAHAGSVSGHGLLQIGESFGGFRLEAFNRETEVLTLADALGKKYELKPPKPTVTNAGPGDGEKRRAAKAKALAEIEDYRKSAMRRFGSASVTVDLDGSLIPDSRKKNYESFRKQAEEKGTLFFPVYVGGAWLNVFVPIKDNNLETRILADVAPEDVEEIMLLSKIARAEAVGRALAGPAIKGDAAAAAAKKE